MLPKAYVSCPYDTVEYGSGSSNKHHTREPFRSIGGSRNASGTLTAVQAALDAGALVRGNRVPHLTEFAGGHCVLPLCLVRFLRGLAFAVFEASAKGAMGIDRREPDVQVVLEDDVSGAVPNSEFSEPL